MHRVSRLGIPLSQFKGQDLEGISGLHFHTLCEQGFDSLERTLDAVEARFGHLLAQMQWVNFGGGHWITAPGYDIDGLVERIKAFSAKYQVQSIWSRRGYRIPGCWSVKCWM